MRNLKPWKYIVLGSVGLLLILGSGRYSSGAIEQEKVLESIQEQIISLRKEFKLRVKRAEEDRHAVYENIRQKLKELVETQTSLKTSQPEMTKKVEKLLPLLETYSEHIDDFEQMLDTMEGTMGQFGCD